MRSFFFAATTSLLVVASFLSRPAEAGASFTITDRVYGNASSGAQQTLVNTVLDALQTSVTDVLDDSLSVLGDDGKIVLKAMANAGVMASPGTGYDVASPFQIASLGAGVGIALARNSADTDNAGKTGLAAIPGLGARVSSVLGINAGAFAKGKFGFFDLNRLRVYLNFFSYELGPFTKDNSTITVNTSAWGLHARYKLIGDNGGGGKGSGGIGSVFFKWDGVDVGLGYHHASNSFVFSTPVKTTSPASGTLSASFDGTAEASIKVATTTIPIEVSTGIRLLYLFDFYLGLGTDLNFGSAAGNASVTGTVSGTDSSGTISGIGGTGNLTAFDESEGPDGFIFRAFAGVNLNLGVFALYAQVGQALVHTKSDDVGDFSGNYTGAAIGARMFW